MIDAMFLRYLMVGVANTAVGYGVILILQFQFNARPVIANASGYLVGLCVNFALNKKFTFRSQRAYRTSIPAFAAAAAACYLLNVAVLQFSILVLDLPAAISQAVAMCTYTVSFYIANRFLVFK